MHVLARLLVHAGTVQMQFRRARNRACHGHVLFALSNEQQRGVKGGSSQFNNHKYARLSLSASLKKVEDRIRFELESQSCTTKI